MSEHKTEATEDGLIAKLLNAADDADELHRAFCERNRMDFGGDSLANELRLQAQLICDNPGVYARG